MSTCNWKPPKDVPFLLVPPHPMSCPENAWQVSSSGRCIFHAPCDDKTADEQRRQFHDALLKKLKREEESDDISVHDCRCYIFPDGFSTCEGRAFKKQAVFMGALFGNETSFMGAKFGEEACFASAAFGARINFYGAKFGDDVDFGGATFDGYVNAINTRFGNGASFWGATFGDKTSFAFAVFGNNVDFGGVFFGNGVDFANSRFGVGARFTEAVLGAGTDFKDTTFDGSVRFEGTGKADTPTNVPQSWGEGGKGTRTCVFTGEVDFRRARFARPREVSFFKVNMSRALLSDVADLEEIRFTDVLWPSAPWRDHAIYDDVKCSETGSSKNIDYSLISSAYRQLMKNYESMREYALAGDFYIGAMETKRLNLRRWRRELWRSHSLLAWLRTVCHSLFHEGYRYASFYGERYEIALFWLVLILFVGGFPNYRHLPPILSAVPTREVFSTIVQYIHAAVLPSLLGLFLLSLRRRFRR